MLSSLDVGHFRCIGEAHLEFDARATGIVGANASGKTSLLEAIYFLAYGRSFRSVHREKLIQHGRDDLQIVSRIERGAETCVAGARFGANGLELRVAGRPASSFSEVAAMLPVQIIDPGVHRLVEEGSARRRRLLDWGVFHVKHPFVDAWRRYQRALRQRNAALRAGAATPVIEAWDAELAVTGTAVDRDRAAYMSSFSPFFRQWAERLVGPEVSITYRRGWASDLTLTEALQNSRARDLRVRTTSVGAHRADLNFTIDGAAARDRVSRGQQKMLASALVLAQVAYRAETAPDQTCLLLDDPAAELDVDNLGKLFRALAEIPAQLIITAVSEAGLQGLGAGRMFHVEQGAVRPAPL